jgi:hypothetical protein
MDMADMIAEVLDRSRRIETRITKIGRAMDVDVGGGRPVWVDGRVTVPTPNCSIGECLKAVPGDWDQSEEIEVFTGDDYLFSFFIEPRTKLSALI